MNPEAPFCARSTPNSCPSHPKGGFRPVHNFGSAFGLRRPEARPAGRPFLVELRAWIKVSSGIFVRPPRFLLSHKHGGVHCGPKRIALHQVVKPMS